MPHGSSVIAAMNGDISSEDAVISVMREREKARQEYQAYKREKGEPLKGSGGPAISSAASPESPRVNKSTDVYIGIALIFTAILSTIWLLKLSGKKKADNNV